MRKSFRMSMVAIGCTLMLLGGVVGCSNKNVSYEGANEFSAKIEMRDSYGMPLPGVTSQLEEPDGTVVGTYVSDAEGVRIDSLKEGKTYLYKVVNLPEGYEGEYSFTITKQDPKVVCIVNSSK